MIPMQVTDEDMVDACPLYPILGHPDLRALTTIYQEELIVVIDDLC
jgi:hypothetical protein